MEVNNEMENWKRQKTENRKRKVERGEEGRKESEMKENHQPIDPSTHQRNFTFILLSTYHEQGPQGTRSDQKDVCLFESMGSAARDGK